MTDVVNKPTSYVHIAGGEPPAAFDGCARPLNATCTPWTDNLGDRLEQAKEAKRARLALEQKQQEQSAAVDQDANLLRDLKATLRVVAMYALHLRDRSPPSPTYA